MTKSQQIDLENALFYRAALLCVSVYSREGRLCSPSQDVLLRSLLLVYNTFFAAENRPEPDADEWQNWWRDFIQNGVLSDGPVYKPDTRMELAWMQFVRFAGPRGAKQK